MKGTFARVAVVLSVLGFVAAACSTSPSVNAKKAPAAIGASYHTVFDLTDKSVPIKLDDIQNGSTLQTALKARLHFTTGGIVGAVVLGTSLLSTSMCQAADVPWPCAKVSYNYLSNASPGGPLKPWTGDAIFVDGRWLVAHATVCGLLVLDYEAEGKSGHPPGCA